MDDSRTQCTESPTNAPNRRITTACFLLGLGAVGTAILSIYSGGLLRGLSDPDAADSMREDASAVNHEEPAQPRKIETNETRTAATLSSVVADGVSSTRLTIEPSESIVSAEPATVVLTVKNDGSSPARITEVRPSCGCTVAGEPDPTEIAAHGSSTIRLRATPPEVGEKRTRVEVFHDALGPPLVAALLLKGRRQASPNSSIILRHPEEIVARGAPNSDCVARFELVCAERKGSEPFVAAIVSDVPEVSISRESIVDRFSPNPGTVYRTYEYVATIVLDKPGRTHIATLSIEPGRKSDDLDLPTISMMADCRASVQAVPDTLFASLGRDDVPCEINLRFRAPSTKRMLEISPASTLPGWLEIGPSTAAAPGSPFAAQIVVRITAMPDRGDDETEPTTVRLRTNVPDCPIIEIPLFVRIKNGGNKSGS
ncbi:MAG TPA: DUF1573 domain-containing protein [Lacipirellulaceae bacterium]|nr:DUF1573 domain-containing protein [Lacipirellulaceae bacterium]